MKSGGALLVDCLKAQEVRQVYTIPGESYLAVLDGLYESGIKNIVARQEGGAAMMAEAEGKLTGRPGIAMVTRGPGACNASAGVHIAKQDSTPMILFVGQIGRQMYGRECFQEVDYRSMFGDLAKWVEQIEHADRIPETVSHAYHVAMSGRPGPVVLALPEDMLREMTDAAPAPPVEVAAPGPTPDAMQRFEVALKGSKNPLLILGGSRWSPSDVEDVQGWAQKAGLPVAVSFRRHGLFDHAHPNFVGDIAHAPPPHLRNMVQDSDLLILLGCRFSETPTQGFTALDIPKPQMKLVHIHPGPEELGRIYAPDLAINATPGAFIKAAKDISAGHAMPKAAHEVYNAHATPQRSDSARVCNFHVMATLREHLPSDAIVTNGAGNYAIWAHQFWPHNRFDGYLGPISGSMGYGLPAAIGAGVNYPDRKVVCFAGDGCFQMTSQEFGTAVEQGLNLLVLIFDNGSYGTIRQHQEKRYPGRVSGTALKNPDFATIAQAYGAFGERVETSDAFEGGLKRALAANGPAILHLINDVDAISPSTRLSEL